jgi:hypothetical protein
MMESLNDLVDFQPEWYKNADDRERKLFRDWLLGVLRMHEDVKIIFTKTDGSIREMVCTLKKDKIPLVEKPRESDSLCTVWDTEISQWRSFKFENIKQINFKL